ncbi:MAG: response regulator transcription factor [Acidobacteria bacterium]|nr:response regulator transcription factor [Acidobacteriota bacterium]
MIPIRVLIVDDERMARERVRRFVSADEGLHLVGECANGAEAADFLSKNPVDLLFLDIQMPGMDGFEVLRGVPGQHLPVVVFVTAHQEHALEAFEAKAFDYLLKPFDQPRFEGCLERAKEQVEMIRKGMREEPLNQALAELRGRRGRTARIPVKNSGKISFVRVEDVDWIEAADNYVCLHVGPETHVLRETMNSIESRLDPGRFLRIHRSRIVNIDRIKELQPWFHGDSIVILHDGTQLTLSRSYRDRLMTALAV